MWVCSCEWCCVFSGLSSKGSADITNMVSAHQPPKTGRYLRSGNILQQSVRLGWEIIKDTARGLTGIWAYQEDYVCFVGVFSPPFPYNHYVIFSYMYSFLVPIYTLLFSLNHNGCKISMREIISHYYISLSGLVAAQRRFVLHKCLKPGMVPKISPFDEIQPCHVGSIISAPHMISRC